MSSEEQTAIRDRRLSLEEVPRKHRTQIADRPASKGTRSWGECQPGRKSLREQTAEVLQDAVHLCVQAGRTREWAVYRIADLVGASRRSVRRWMESGVPEGDRRGEVLYDAAQRVVRQARILRSLRGGGLREFRRRYDLTQQDLADEAGCSLRTIGYVERGEAEPSPRTLVALEDAISAIVRRSRGSS